MPLWGGDTYGDMGNMGNMGIWRYGDYGDYKFGELMTAGGQSCRWNTAVT